MKQFRQKLSRAAVCLSLLTTCVSPSLRAAEPQFDVLTKVATDALEFNIVKLSSGSYLRAGGHQFQSLWTRDFVYASRGLLALGHSDVVRDQLDLLLGSPLNLPASAANPLASLVNPKAWFDGSTKLVKYNGILPKYFDSINIFERYRLLIMEKDPAKRTPQVTDDIKPGYMAGIPPSISFDSNALVLLVALDYVQATGDQAWWNARLPQLVKTYQFYHKFLDAQGLVLQPEYSDWQDSAKRVGKTFYVNLLYYTASERLRSFPEFGISSDQIRALRAALQANFFDAKLGIYKGIVIQQGLLQKKEVSYYGLDGNLLAIDLGFVKAGTPEALKLFRSLQKAKLPVEGSKTGATYSLWSPASGFPGITTIPNYPENFVTGQVSPFATVSGVGHYHDSITWSWLLALSAKVAHLVGDDTESDRILTQFEAMAARDRTIYEIYETKPSLVPYNVRYKSESPFSWGSGMVLDALNSRHSLR